VAGPDRITCSAVFSGPAPSSRSRKSLTTTISSFTTTQTFHSAAVPARAPRPSSQRGRVEEYTDGQTDQPEAVLPAPPASDGHAVWVDHDEVRFEILEGPILLPEDGHGGELEIRGDQEVARLQADGLGGHVGLLAHGDDGGLEGGRGEDRAGVGGAEVGGDDADVLVVDRVEEGVGVVDVPTVGGEEAVDELGQREGGGDGQLLRDLLDGVEVVVDDGLAGDLDEVAPLGRGVGGRGVGERQGGVGGVFGDGGEGAEGAEADAGLGLEILDRTVLPFC
jgi:hypothetical protein